LYQDAISFQVHKMATDAGIRWAAECVREFQSPERKKGKDEPLEAADRWGCNRRTTRRGGKANDAASRSKNGGPSDLVALAVFFSGGSITPPGAPETTPPPYTAQKMIAGSIVVAVCEPRAGESDGALIDGALAMGKALDRPGRG